MDYQSRIANFYKRNRRMPNYAEIMQLTGFKSKNAVSKLVARLQEQGVIDKDSKGFSHPEAALPEIY